MGVVRAALTGAYPRVGEEKDHQRFRRAAMHFEGREISAHALRDVLQSVVQETLFEQAELGLDEVTDGLIGRTDPVTPFCRGLSGITTAGLARLFDTNFYYRVPVIGAKPRIKETLAEAEWPFVAKIMPRPARFVVTGPVTLARLVKGAAKPFDKPAARETLFTDVIAREIAAAAKLGATIIQVEDPLLLHPSADWKAVPKIYDTLAAEKGKARLALSVAFAPCAGAVDRLRALPIDELDLDLTFDADRTAEALFKNPGRTTIGFGLVDARRTRLEPPGPAVDLLRRWLDKSGHEACFVTPSTGLEFLPRTVAREKLRLLSQIKHMAVPHAG